MSVVSITERPAALLDALLKTCPTAVALLRPLPTAPAQPPTDFDWVYLNPAGQRLLGQPPQPALSLRTLFPGAEVPGLLAACQQAFLTGATQHGCTAAFGGAAVQLTAQRHEELVLVQLAPAPAGPPDTAPVRPAEAAPTPLNELDRVFAQAPVAIAVFRGPQYRIELANDLHLALWGRTREQVLGRPLFEALPEAAGIGYEELLAGVLTTGVPYVARELSAPLVRNGVREEVFFNFVYQPLYEADGRISGVVVVAHDITEQVRSRQQAQQLTQELELRIQERTQQLLEQQLLITSVFEQAPAGVWVVRGADYVFELYNPQMGRVLGPTPEQALGRPYFEVMPELVSQGIPELLRQVWESGEPVIIEEYPAQLHRHAPGEGGYFTFSFQPLRDAHGQVTRIGCVALDVTTQVLARQQVQQLNQQLTAANQELHTSNTRLRHTNADLDTFVYTASHDLNAPITNLEGLLAVLREETAAGHWTDPAARVLTLMQDAVERFRTTLGHLTEVTRVQYDAAPAAPVAVAPIVAGVELDLAPQLAEAQAQVTVDVAECPTLPAAAKTIRSLVYNLLSNALKYRAPGRPPRVHIRCWCHGPEARLAVTDNGLGLDLSRQTELFTMFRRYHTHVEGAGVGLYMVKRMVEHAGGRIEVQSQLGEGSTFTVAFPLPNG